MINKQYNRHNDLYINKELIKEKTIEHNMQVTKEGYKEDNEEYTDDHVDNKENGIEKQNKEEHFNSDGFENKVKISQMKTDNGSRIGENSIFPGNHDTNEKQIPLDNTHLTASYKSIIIERESYPLQEKHQENTNSLGTISQISLHNKSKYIGNIIGNNHNGELIIAPAEKADGLQSKEQLVIETIDNKRECNNGIIDDKDICSMVDIEIKKTSIASTEEMIIPMREGTTGNMYRHKSENENISEIGENKTDNDKEQLNKDKQ